MPHPAFVILIPNLPRRVIRTALGLALFGFVLAVLLGVLGQTEARFAGVVLSGFASLFGLLTAWVYLPRAREFDRLLKREPPLFIWEYNHREWLEYVRENYQRDFEGNWGLWMLVAAICAVVGGGLATLFQDALFLWITMGLALFLILPAVGVPKVRRWRLLHNPHQAILNRRAVWIGGRFQTWTVPGTHLIAVGIDPVAGLRWLWITFRFNTRTGTQDETVRIPIPVGQENAAEIALKELQKGICAEEAEAEL